MSYEPEGLFSDAPRPAAAPSADKRPIWTLTLRPEPGTDDIRSMRWLLKGLLRRFGFRCLSIKRDEAR